jgi:hypothetical protein
LQAFLPPLYRVRQRTKGRPTSASSPCPFALNPVEQRHRLLNRK